MKSWGSLILGRERKWIQKLKEKHTSLVCQFIQIHLDPFIQGHIVHSSEKIVLLVYTTFTDCKPCTSQSQTSNSFPLLNLLKSKDKGIDGNFAGDGWQNGGALVVDKGKT